jgi:glycosyltransferase involved in cell wall biosynthesis
VRLLVDGLSAREGGGVTYLTHILPALRNRRPDWELVVLLSSQYQSELARELPRDIRAITPCLIAFPPVQRLWYLQTSLPRLVHRHRFDVVFTIAEVGTFTSPCPSVVLSANPNFFAAPGTIPGLKNSLLSLLYRALWTPFVRLTVAHADRVLFVSDTFRLQVLQSMRIRTSKTGVVHHGLNPQFTAGGHQDGSRFDGRPYLLSVSTINPHKNYEVLLDGFARLVGDGAFPTLQLAIAGSTSIRPYHELLVARAKALGVSDRVHFLGRLPYGELPALYRGAAAFVFPSRVETFGLPLLEAMGSGVPVIASDLPVSQEVCQDAARYFGPDDMPTLVEQVRAVLGSSEIREQMIHAGLRRASDFSWDRAAEQVATTLEDAVHVRHRGTR